MMQVRDTGDTELTGLLHEGSAQLAPKSLEEVEMSVKQL